MKFYLDSILKGFKPVNSEVVLEGVSRQTPNFVLVDIDQDGMPEILFAYQSNGEKYIGILKREDMKWYLYNVSLEKNQKAIGLGNLVNILNGVNLTQEDIGKVVTMKDLVGNNDQAFISYINDMMNHGVVVQGGVGEETNNTQTNQQGLTGAQIIAQTGKLPPPENINTPQAQAALNQNVITPIMSVNETDQVVNSTPVDEETLADAEMPPVKVYFIDNPTNMIGSNIDSDKEVIHFAQADVTGDGIPDSIYLVGNRPRPQMPGYVENLGLRVTSGGKVYEVDFPYGNGYSPILFVGDLTQDGVNDILVNIFAGGDGGFLTSYAYSFANEQPRLLVDSKTFNDLQTGTVTYQDNYRVQIQTLRPPRIYTIDISDRGPDYLNEIYNEDGTLRRPLEGTLLGLIALHPVDFDVNGQYNLSAVQRAIGLTNLDTLGLLETYFSWRPAISRFQPFAQYFSILGQPTT